MKSEVDSPNNHFVILLQIPQAQPRLKTPAGRHTPRTGKGMGCLDLVIVIMK